MYSLSPVLLDYICKPEICDNKTRKKARFTDLRDLSNTTMSNVTTTQHTQGQTSQRLLVCHGVPVYPLPTIACVSGGHLQTNAVTKVDNHPHERYSSRNILLYDGEVYNGTWKTFLPNCLNTLDSQRRVVGASMGIDWRLVPMHMCSQASAILNDKRPQMALSHDDNTKLALPFNIETITPEYLYGLHHTKQRCSLMDMLTKNPRVSVHDISATKKNVKIDQSLVKGMRNAHIVGTKDIVCDDYYFFRIANGEWLLTQLKRITTTGTPKTMKVLISWGNKEKSAKFVNAMFHYKKDELAGILEVLPYVSILEPVPCTSMRCGKRKSSAV